jgi:hypothetical protein
VAERDRTDDDDLEFDFFDEPTGVEAATEVKPPPRRPLGGGPPVRPRAPGTGAPIFRLALLIGGAIVVAIALVFGINSCRGSGAKGEYQDYMQSVNSVAGSSASTGKQLGDLLAEQGLSLDDLQAGLGALADQQHQAVVRAQDLEAPSPLLEEQRSLEEAMQLRESGLRGLERAVSQLQQASEAGTAGETLAQQASRLVAGDVVYDDLFKARAEEVLQQEGIQGVAVPESTFLSDPAQVTATSLTELVQRITTGGGSTDGEATGLHGNGIEVVRVKDGAELSTDVSENTIVVTDSLAIEVVVKNSGDFQETNVQVTLTIQQGAEPIKKTQKVKSINQGDTAVVTFENFENLPYTALTTLKVAVKPVAGEENTSNNTFEYPVIFTL